jgi:hypothetical protein
MRQPTQRELRLTHRAKMRGKKLERAERPAEPTLYYDRLIPVRTSPLATISRRYRYRRRDGYFKRQIANHGSKVWW